MQGQDSSLASSGWRQFDFAGLLSRICSPLRPAPSDVANLSRAVSAEGKRILLLGVTPELSILGADLTAVDNDQRMIDNVWPGTCANRRALLADWTDLPFPSESFDAVIGDASPNAAAEQAGEVLAEARRVLAPGGTAAFRLFCSPEKDETLEFIREDVAAGWQGNFHAMKWRIAMALAGPEPRGVIPVREILAAFDRLFPDRRALAAATGWPDEDIATIDAYAGAAHSLGFPRLSAMLELLEPHFGDVSVIEAEGYPLAERCPTVVCRT